MSAFFTQSLFLGVFLSLGAYQIGRWAQRRTGWALCNPLLVAVIIVIAALLVLGVDYPTYMLGGRYVTFWLTPATVCLAIPLHRQFELLKKDAAAILIGSLAGVIACLSCILLFAAVFHFTRAQYLSFLPKSITTAVGLGLSEELGGDAAATAATILITGLSGNILAPLICRVLRITHPVAKGVGIGTSAHAIGTVKALEMGAVEGAMSSLALVVTSLLTVLIAPLFAALY